jgi:NADPH2:quinone reductase
VKELTGGAGVSACSTASASGRSTRRSPASRRAGCWCCSARRRAPCRRRPGRAGARVAVPRPPVARHYVAARDELVDVRDALFEVVGSGAVKVDVGQSYALWDAAAAHRDLEARKTTGSTLLIP